MKNFLNWNGVDRTRFFKKRIVFQRVYRETFLKGLRILHSLNFTAQSILGAHCQQILVASLF